MIKCRCSFEKKGDVMKEGDRVVYKKEVIEKLVRNGNNTQISVEMEVCEVRSDVIVVKSGECRIRVNPNAIELA